MQFSAENLFRLTNEQQINEMIAQLSPVSEHNGAVLHPGDQRARSNGAANLNVALLNHVDQRTATSNGAANLNVTLPSPVSEHNGNNGAANLNVASLGIDFMNPTFDFQQFGLLGQGDMEFGNLQLGPIVFHHDAA